MRISQLQLLDECEAELLLYIVNVLEPIQSPHFEIQYLSELLWIRQDELLKKVARQESKLTDEGKKVFKSLMVKLTKTAEQEREDYENSTKPELTQSEFQF